MKIFYKLFCCLLTTCNLLFIDFPLQAKQDPYETIIEVIRNHPKATQDFITNLRRNMISWGQAIDRYGADLNLDESPSSVLIENFLRKLQKNSIGRYEFAQKLQTFLSNPSATKTNFVTFLRNHVSLDDLMTLHKPPLVLSLKDPYEKAASFFNKSSSDALKNLVVYLQNKELTWGSMIRLYKEDLEQEGIKLPSAVEAFLINLHFETEWYLFILAETFNCFLKKELTTKGLAKSLKTYFPLQKIETPTLEPPQNSDFISDPQDFYTPIAQFLLDHGEISENLIANLYNKELSVEDIIILFESSIEEDVPDSLLENLKDIILHYIERDNFADHLNMLLGDGDISVFSRFLQSRLKSAQEYDDEEEEEDRRLKEL